MSQLTSSQINEMIAQMDSISKALRTESFAKDIFPHVYKKSGELHSAAIFAGLRGGHFDPQQKPKDL